MPLVVGFVVMMALAAYMARGVQVFTASKRSEEQHHRRESDVPLVANSDNLPPLPPPPPQLRVQDHHYAQDASSPAAGAVSAAQSYTQAPLPASRAERWAATVTKHLDAGIMGAVFVVVGVPLYYATGYAMPAHLTANTLAYYAALAMPLPWKTFLHPLPVASLLTVLVVWPLAAIRGDSLTTALEAYKTGAGYLYLWTAGPHDEMPGAGDVFGTILDAGIVALALPMFQHRRELRNHYVAILLPNVVIAAATLFVYPPLCVALGIAAPRSLAFASRSLTLALALPATKNLGGDVATVAALAIASGISGVLVGNKMLAWIKIPKGMSDMMRNAKCETRNAKWLLTFADDYVTRGIALGVNSSAIATAVLLRTDPRAAALSSLSMTLFGTVTVLFTSIPPMVVVIRSLVGL